MLAVKWNFFFAMERRKFKRVLFVIAMCIVVYTFHFQSSFKGMWSFIIYEISSLNFEIFIEKIAGKPKHS